MILYSEHTPQPRFIQPENQEKIMIPIPRIMNIPAKVWSFTVWDRKYPHPVLKRKRNGIIAASYLNLSGYSRGDS